MLVLTQHEDNFEEDAIIIVPPSDEPTEITVSLCEIRGDKCRIGYSADNSVQIDRRSVRRAKDADLAKSLASSPAAPASAEPDPETPAHDR